MVVVQWDSLSLVLTRQLWILIFFQATPFMEANFRLLASGYVGIVSVFLGSGANVNTQKACTAISLEICWFINMKLDDDTVW